LIERDHSGNIDVDGRIILKLIFKKWNGCMDCIAPTQNRDRQGALVNVVIKLCIPQNVGNLGEFID
jgi:hypothetical protein